MAELMYKNVYYDSRTNKIHLWHVVNGVNQKDVYDYSHDYWQTAMEGDDLTNSKKDLFGKDMVQKSVERKRDMPKHLHYSDIAEGDVKEETKFLHKMFASKVMSPNIDNLQVMTYDIEVRIGRNANFKDEYTITCRDIDTLEETVHTIATYEALPNMGQYEVYDLQKGMWLSYPDSVYHGSSEFPKPAEAKFAVNAIAQHFSKENVLYLYADKDFKYVLEHDIDAKGNKIPKTYGSIDDMKVRLQQETGIKLKDIICLVFSDEKKLLETFMKNLHKHKTDVITGWNTARFDNPYVSMRLENLGSKASFSPIQKEFSRVNHLGDLIYKYRGISAIDYFELYKNKFTFDNKGYYTLDNIVRIELKKSKLEYNCSMKEFYQNYWDDFMLYNAIDTMLVVALDRKKGFMALGLTAAHAALVTYDDIMGTVAGLDGTVQNQLHNMGIVMNDRDPHAVKEKFPGGFSWCLPGLYHYGVSFDIVSMYPHLMDQHNVSIETQENWAEEDLKNVIRVNDTVNKKSYYFWPDHPILVDRDSKIQQITAKEILATDAVILKPNKNGINHEGKNDWNYDMGVSFEKEWLSKV
jgi:hypothetical protein